MTDIEILKLVLDSSRQVQKDKLAVVLRDSYEKEDKEVFDDFLNCLPENIATDLVFMCGAQVRTLVIEQSRKIMAKLPTSKLQQ